MINYGVQVVLFQVLFLAVYDFFLQKETFFKWNRVYLLVMPFLAFIIPWLKMDSIQKTIPQEYMVYLPEVIINPKEVLVQTANSGNEINYILIIFWIGVAVFTSLFLFKLIKIIRLILTHKVIKRETHSLVILKDKEVAFSFFRYIFINEKLLKNMDLQIIQHELIHCNQRHTIDLLLFEILKIVQWFNPIIYQFQQRITVLHEYLSDEEIVKQTNAKTYFNKLLSETFKVENITFINQFYKQSLIKKRIAMITKNKSQKIKQLKYLLIAPLLFAMLIFSSFQNKSIEISNNKEIKYSKDTVNPKNTIPFALIKKVPIYPGCEGKETVLRKCLQDKISKYVNKNFNASIASKLNLQSGIKRIFVMFTIDKQGNVTNIRARATHKKIEEEAYRVIKSLPRMIPGEYKGKVVNIKYSLPIAIKVDNNQQSRLDNQIFKKVKGNKITKNGNDVPFAVIDEVPVYPGCKGKQATLRKCLQDNITQLVSNNFKADLAKNLGLSPGVKRIFVMVTINKEGKITNIQARAPHIKLQEEAIRVIKLIPKMIPGKQGGKAVNVKYSLPIAFMVEDKNSEKAKLPNTHLKEISLYVIDGKEVAKEKAQKLDATSIKIMNILKGEKAIEKYGEKGKNGVIEITTKKRYNLN